MTIIKDLKTLDISNNTKVVFDIGAHIGLCTLP